MPSPVNKRSAKNHPSSVAKNAARNAMLKVAGTTKVSQNQLERVVQSVNDATKRLSQPESILSTSTTTKSSKRKSRDTVGPWKLGKTLGKGSSGRVRLAKNMETGQLAAIKIVPRKNNMHSKAEATSTCSSVSYLSTSSNATSTMLNTTANANTNAGHANNATNPYGIEREIVIMKLISHANVLGLYEVWENKSELYLVLEYVDSGELFDYLVSKGKLGEREAVHYFKQIVQGVSYCHSFNICHRDLKPENLLLDKKNRTIKIADFGMAALEVSNKLLETSCGSPHYASPEIVMGRPYHGGPSDVWSCGIILFALLTGHLPFNDDSIKKLLLKVQSGRYQMPMSLSKEARDLISKILVVNPARRITTEEILSHPLIIKYERMPSKSKGFKTSNANLGRGKSNSDLHLLNEYDSAIVSFKSKQDIDETILSNLQILWHGASRELITAKLLQPSMCEEKVFYSLLLKYKEKHSSGSDTNAVPQELEAKQANDINENTCRDFNAPKLLQKSQFSIPSLRQEESPSSAPELPSNSFSPALPVFAVSSSRTFKKSGSIMSMQSQRSLHSKASIIKSSSKKSLNGGNSRKTLQNSSSKRSLYSLTSISKRSLNLNDYVTNENGDFDAFQLPPLPSLDSNNDFEDLCEQILFGNALDKILEEEEEDEESKNIRDTSKSSNETLKEMPRTQPDLCVGPPEEDIMPAFALQEQQDTNVKQCPPMSTVSSSRMPLKDLTNTSHRANPSFNTKMKRDVSQKSNLSDILTISEGSNKYPGPAKSMSSAFSSKTSKESAYSLDPRHGVSQPANAKVVESLLHKFRHKSNTKEARRSGDWSYKRGSIFRGEDETSKEDMFQERRSSGHATSDTNTTNPILGTLSDFDNTELDVLAHSSNVNTKPLVSLPSSFLNPSMSFKNLSEYLQESNKSYIPSSKRSTLSRETSLAGRKPSTRVSLAPKSANNAGLGGRGLHSQTNSSVSNDFSLISDMSYALEIPTNTFMAQAVTISTPDSAERIVAEPIIHESHKENDTIYYGNNTPATIYDDTRVNIFEDAPTDSETIDVTSSEGDSIPNVHRKAVSIETLNNTNVLLPSTNMRVSLYGNHNTNSNPVLARETTEEIISKFKMPVEKSSTDVIQRRPSTTTASRHSYTRKGPQSMMSMFKDVEDDENEERLSQSIFQGTSKNLNLDDEAEFQPNRVTMLFDGDEEEHHRAKEEHHTAKEEHQRVEEYRPQSQRAVLTHRNTSEPDERIEKKNVRPKVKAVPKGKQVPKPKMAGASYNGSMPKKNWFRKFLSGFKTNHEDIKFVRAHKTCVSFDDAHMLTLNEFDKNAVEYYLKNSERKNQREIVEYDCRFVKGNFKFKIKIVCDDTETTNKPTVITIKKKSGKNTLDSEHAFQIFNADVAKVIRQLELKNKSR